jgi:hypothetical protein
MARVAFALAVAIAVAFAWAPPARAHCDGLDGPVVTAARQALDAADPRPILVWVQPRDEAEARAAFERTLAVRKLGDEARDLADRFFFETVVRLHRAGEGAPYTGLAPAGRDLGPAIPAADRALEARSADALVTLLTDAVRRGTTARLREASAPVAPGDVDAGRRRVRAYVELVHYVERVYEAASRDVHGHYAEEDAAQAPHE